MQRSLHFHRRFSPSCADQRIISIQGVVNNSSSVFQQGTTHEKHSIGNRRPSKFLVKSLPPHSEPNILTLHLTWSHIFHHQMNATIPSVDNPWYSTTCVPFLSLAGCPAEDLQAHKVWAGVWLAFDISSLLFLVVTLLRRVLSVRESFNTIRLTLIKFILGAPLYVQRRYATINGRTPSLRARSPLLHFLFPLSAFFSFTYHID